MLERELVIGDLVFVIGRTNKYEVKSIDKERNYVSLCEVGDSWIFSIPMKKIKGLVWWCL